MELILLKDVDEIGFKGEVIRVRDGFARNFLLPRKLALPCSSANQAFVESQKARAAQRRAKEKTDAQSRAKSLSEIKLTLQAAAGDQDKLFGSVTSEDIRNALAERGVEVEKKKIHLKDPIRNLGSHTVSVELYPQVKASVVVEVVRQS